MERRQVGGDFPLQRDLFADEAIEERLQVTQDARRVEVLKASDLLAGENEQLACECPRKDGRGQHRFKVVAQVGIRIRRQ